MKIRITIPAHLEANRLKNSNPATFSSERFLPQSLISSRNATLATAAAATTTAHEVTLGTRAASAVTPETVAATSRELLAHSLAAAALYELGFRRATCRRHAPDCTAIEI